MFFFLKAPANTFYYYDEALSKDYNLTNIIYIYFYRHIPYMTQKSDIAKGYLFLLQLYCYM